MRAYVVSYRKGADDVHACANLVYADDYKQVSREFVDCDWFVARIAAEWEVRECRAKGVPERWL